MDPTTKKLQVDQSLDLRGVERVSAYHQARERLDAMAENCILELYLEEGESLRSVPFGLRADGHEIVVSEPASPGVRLLIRKRSLITGA